MDGRDIRKKEDHKVTYEVNGPEVVYLGAGAYHDPKYDHVTIGSLVSDLRFFSNKHSTYSGLPREDSFCPLYVYLCQNGSFP
jgi:hypothetical protein